MRIAACCCVSQCKLNGIVGLLCTEKEASAFLLLCKMLWHIAEHRTILQPCVSVAWNENKCHYLHTCMQKKMSANMCAYTHVISVYMRMYMYQYTHTFTSTHMCIYTHVNIHIYAHTPPTTSCYHYIYAQIHIRTYTWMHTHCLEVAVVSIYTIMHIHIFTRTAQRNSCQHHGNVCTTYMDTLSILYARTYPPPPHTHTRTPGHDQ